MPGAVRPYGQATEDFKFAAAVASFGMILRDSPHKGTASYGTVMELGQEAVGEGDGGYRREFIELVELAQRIATQ